MSIDCFLNTTLIYKFVSILSKSWWSIIKYVNKDPNIPIIVHDPNPINQYKKSMKHGDEIQENYIIISDHHITIFNMFVLNSLDSLHFFFYTTKSKSRSNTGLYKFCKCKFLFFKKSTGWMQED